MKHLSLLALLCSFSLQGGNRKMVSPELLGEAEPGTTSVRASVRSAGTSAKANLQRAADPAVPQAPVVLQVYRLDGVNFGWAVTTDTLAKGTTLTFITVNPNGQQVKQQPFVLNDSVDPRTSFNLPDIATFGPLWTKGVETYDLLVTSPDGKISHCATDFTVGGYARTADEISRLLPWMKSYSYSQGDNGSPLLNVEGVFSGDPLSVLLEDVVVPREAIVSQSSSRLVINVGAVPNFKLSDQADYLLTVAQGGWADTFPVRSVAPR